MWLSKILRVSEAPAFFKETQMQAGIRTALDAAKTSTSAMGYLMMKKRDENCLRLFYDDFLDVTF